MNLLFGSRYHIFIVSLYALLCIYFFFFTDLSQTLFIFSLKDLAILLPLLASSLMVFFIANYFLRFGTIGLQRENISKLPLIILYASFLIAAPEEILFRGLIQTYLQTVFTDPIISIFFSSLCFGFAHSLNGSKGFSPVKWNWKLIIMTFLAGIFLGISFYITGSLAIPILLHAVLVTMMKIFIKEIYKHN